MKTSLSAEKKQEYATKLTLIGFFISVFLAIAFRKPAKTGKKAAKIKPFDVALMGLSTYRLGRMIAYDRVTEPVRLFFTETVPDASGAGETVVPAGQGARNAIGQLLSCPICSGTWVAAALVYAFHFFEAPTRMFMAIIASTALAELLDALTEDWQWSGQAARKQAGGG
jgi:hypothetical protein